MKYVRNSSGFTLFELVTVMAVISIIVLISSPFFTSLLKQNEANKIYYSLKPILTDARTQAYSLHRAVGLCGSNDGLTCNNDWLLIFHFKGVNCNANNPQPKQTKPKNAVIVMANSEICQKYKDNRTDWCIVPF